MPPSTGGRRRGPLDPRLLQRSRPVAALLIMVVAVGILTAVVIVATAWVLAHAVADTVQGRTLTAAWAAVPTLIGLLVVRAVLTGATPALSARATTLVKTRLRDEIMTSALGDGGQRAPGPVVALLTKGLDALDSYVGRYLPQLALAVTVPVVVGLAVLSQDLLSTVIIAATVPLVPLFMILVGWTTQRLTERSWRRQSRLAQHLSDLLLGLRTLQLFGRAQSQLESLRRTNDEHRRETMTTLRLAFLSALVLELLATLSVALVAVTIGLRVVAGDLDLATGLFVLIIAPEVYLPLRRVGSAYHDAADGTAALDAADALRPSTSSRGRDDGAGGRGDDGLALRGITVSHPGAVRPVLRDLDLTVAPGELVVVAGPSGSGKSTLLDLVMGFVEPTAGTLTGPPVSSMAWLGQQPGLLTGTIADNLRVAAPDADDRLLVDALVRAAAGDLDPGRQVGERGELLSAGELRRVGLARALLRLDRLPPGTGLLVLDEPTAGLDAETEARVMLRVVGEARRAGHAALVVSHRPAVLAAADRVVTLGSEAWTVAA